MSVMSGIGRGFRSFLGGFEAALSNRRLRGFMPSRSHVNTLMAAAGADIVARSRHLVRNNGYANNAVEAYVGNVVGAGIVPTFMVPSKAAKKSIGEAWEEFAETCDSDGSTDFYGVQRRVAREVYVGGEAFVIMRALPRSSGLAAPLRLQVLSSEMLPYHKTEFTGAAPGSAIRQGIEFNAAGERVAYHFWRRHPGDISEPLGAGADTVRIPADQVLHIRDTTEAGRASRREPVRAGDRQAVLPRRLR